MFWLEIQKDLESGCKVRRSKWREGVHLIYNPMDKRTMIYKKHKYKPWTSQKNDLTEASDWEIMN